jgi:hypothetical protein
MLFNFSRALFFAAFTFSRKMQLHPAIFTLRSLFVSLAVSAPGS